MAEWGFVLWRICGGREIEIFHLYSSLRVRQRLVSCNTKMKGIH